MSVYTVIYYLLLFIYTDVFKDERYLKLHVALAKCKK